MTFSTEPAMSLAAMPVRHEHVVEYYDDDSGFIEAISDYLASALRGGRSAVIIASQLLRKRLAAGLQARSVDLEQAHRDGRCREADAEEALARFMVDGRPDAERFAGVIGGLLQPSGGDAGGPAVPRPVVFGEIVSILWQKGEHEAALSVERFWNQIAQSHNFSLLCAYPKDAFSHLADSACFQSGRAEHAQRMAALRGGAPASEGRQRAVARLQQRVHTLEAEITARKAAEEQARQAREEAEILNEVALTLAGGLDLEQLVQRATDAATKLTNAKFGAFFYNVTDEHGESYRLYALSGAPREAFAKFGVPRNTSLFGATFRGEAVVRMDDVLADPRYGKNPPHQGMPRGHLPVRSYLATPVVSRSGEVLGGLFFGHPDPGVFTQRAERLSVGIAAQAAIAIDNARLYASAQKDRAQAQADAERLRAVFDSAAVGVAVLTPGARFLEANGAFCAITGYSEQELRTLDGAGLTHPDDLAAMGTAIARLLSGESSNMVLDNRFRRKDGRIIWVQSSVSVTRDAAGRPDHLIALCDDISARKTAEAFLIEQGESLRLIALGRPLDDCLAALCGSVSRLDPGTRACMLIADGERLRFPRSIAPDLPFSFQWGLKDAPINELAIGICRGKALFRGARVACADIAHDTRWSKVWRDLFLGHGILACYAAPVIGLDGLALGSFLLCFSRAREPGPLEHELADFGTRIASIAFERERAALLRQQAEQVLRRSEKLAAVGRMAACVAHEINNPLQSVANCLFLARTDPGLSAQTREHLKLAGEEVGRVAQVARQTLRIHRDPGAAEWLDVAGTVEDLIEFYGYRLRNRGVRLEKDWHGPVKLFALAGELRQVLWNLFINAVDAMPASGGRLRVRVRATRSWADSGRPGVRISVADNGCGIAPRHMDKIFEPFHTTKQETGTGLGLWVSQAIVLKNGGRIRVRSRAQREGGGTVFSIFWPSNTGDDFVRSGPPHGNEPTQYQNPRGG